MQLKPNVVLCVCFQTMSWLTESNKRREANVRDSAALDDPAVTFRSLHQSVSCDTILVDTGNLSAPDAAVVTAGTNGRQCGRFLSLVELTTTIRLRLNCCSSAIRLHYDPATIIRRHMLRPSAHYCRFRVWYLRRCCVAQREQINEITDRFNSLTKYKKML